MIDWIGARDANCPWPGVLSFVNCLDSTLHPLLLTYM